MSRYGPEENERTAQLLADELVLTDLTAVPAIDTGRAAAGAQVVIRDAAGVVQMIVTVRRHNIGITGMDRAQPPYSLPRNASISAVVLMVRAALEYRGPVSS